MWGATNSSARKSDPSGKNVDPPPVGRRREARQQRSNKAKFPWAARLAQRMLLVAAKNRAGGFRADSRRASSRAEARSLPGCPPAAQSPSMIGVSSSPRHRVFRCRESPVSSTDLPIGCSDWGRPPLDRIQLTRYGVDTAELSDIMTTIPSGKADNVGWGRRISWC